MWIDVFAQVLGCDAGMELSGRNKPGKQNSNTHFVRKRNEMETISEVPHQPREHRKHVDVNVDNLFATSSYQQYEVHVWNSKSNRFVETLAWGSSGFFHADFSYDNSLLATGDSDGRIIIWNLRFLCEVVRLQHRSTIWNVCFPSNNNEYTASLDEDAYFRTNIWVWNLVSCQRLYSVSLSGSRYENIVRITVDCSRIVAFNENTV
jgi:WD40 repeat protein